jgi:hypothetical protein
MPCHAQRRAAEPQQQERGSVSRSTVATKDPRDFSKAWFQAELLRVTDPRFHELAQPAKALTDSRTNGAGRPGNSQARTPALRQPENCGDYVPQQCQVKYFHCQPGGIRVLSSSSS